MVIRHDDDVFLGRVYVIGSTKPLLSVHNELWTLDRAQAYNIVPDGVCISRLCVYKIIRQ